MSAKDKKSSAAYEKKVRAAVVELEKEGKRVTNASVREKLGGGSFRDISPIVQAIKAEKEAREKAASQVPEMPEEVRELATALWEGAYRFADEVAAADRRQHAEEIKDLRQELSDRDEEIGLVEDERDVMEARAASAEAEASRLSELVNELQLKIAGLEGRLLGREEAQISKDWEAKKTAKPAASKEEDEDQIPLFQDDSDAQRTEGSRKPAKDEKPGSNKAA